MESRLTTHKRNWTLVFGFAILIELIIKAGYTLISFNSVVEAVLDFSILLVNLSILFLHAKGNV